MPCCESRLGQLRARARGSGPAPTHLEGAAGLPPNTASHTSPEATHLLIQAQARRAGSLVPSLCTGGAWVCVYDTAL